MKKMALLLSILSVLLCFTACGSANQEPEVNKPETSQSSTQDSTKDNNSGSSTEESTFTGILDDNKDFMIIVNSEDNQDSYIFDLDGVTCDAEIGDKVTVTYKGNIDDPDANLTATKVEKVQ